MVIYEAQGKNKYDILNMNVQHLTLRDVKW